MVIKVRHSAAAYFALQGIAVIAWWAVLWFYPASRQYFVLETGSETSLLAFWLAGLAFLGLGSLVTAYLCLYDHEYKQIAAWFVTGSVSYAAVYCGAFALLSDVGWLGVTLMLPAMIWSGVFATGLSFEKTMFRPARRATASWIVTKTMTQIIIVWSLILVVFPYLITIVEDKLGITRLAFPFQGVIAGILFVAVSSLGIFSSVVMSRIGQGTPLPLDHARELVIVGTYSYVRNPMAVSGIAQGLAVALFLGSPLVAAYALMGSAIWQLIFRPLEEDDLRRRFGQPYDDYCREVKCWIPRISPYMHSGKEAATKMHENSPT